jgi:hypothetical protein
MIILGVTAVCMTVRLTSDMAGRLFNNPKLFLTNGPWIPAPATFRIFGAASLVLGIGLVSFAIVWNRKTKSRTGDSSQR